MEVFALEHFFGPKMPRKFTGSINFALEVSFLPWKFPLRINFALEVFTKEQFCPNSLQNVAILPFYPPILNLTIKLVKDHTCFEKVELGVREGDP